MATDVPTTTLEESGTQASRRWRRLKGILFESILVAATLFGLLALVAIVVLIGLDALAPLSAGPSWYLIYLVTLVTPTSAATLYIRRHPPARRVNATAFAVTFGALTVSFVAYVIPEALSPYDVAIFALFAFVPPTIVIGYTRVRSTTHLTGPVVPVSVLGGILAAFASYGVVRPIAGIVARWVVYVVLVTVPVAISLGVLADRRHSRRAGFASATAVVTAAALAGVIGIARGVDPSMWVVAVSAFVAPVAFLVGDVLVTRREGRVGLIGPVVVVGGVLLGAWLTARLGVAGPDSWLTPTLLFDSWSSFRPREAGVYPQIVGSILIVSMMAVLAFPVGIAAAVYLEEYAPSTGRYGRVIDALDVNISNLAGVPSVVYGLLGLALFRRVGGLEPGIVLAASATLGLLILPIVIVSSQEALRAVPPEVREGSLGLGASRWQTVRNVVLPEAVPGILTGTILALGRAIGETAPLVMIGVATTKFSAPNGLLSGATALPLQIFAAKGNNIPEYREGVVAATAIVLLALLIGMNAAAILIRNRYQREDQ
ncbi:phosphate ABC transporter permease PstA [Halopenitus sp. H-Gu1]|uniref:phosphate ABC transporter permease PstA n=1 Tax=Halopenitus sp. H-Gu1 TaxID=3242697 RepID=UPI00359EAC83